MTHEVEIVQDYKKKNHKYSTEKHKYKAVKRFMEA